MVKWWKNKWQKLVRWYNRVFRGIYVSVKPSGTISVLTGVSSGIFPHYGLEMMAHRGKLVYVRPTYSERTIDDI